MPRFKPYDYSQLQMVPVSLEQQLMAGTLEHAIHYLIEERLDNSTILRFTQDGGSLSMTDRRHR